MLAAPVLSSVPLFCSPSCSKDRRRSARLRDSKIIGSRTFTMDLRNHLISEIYRNTRERICAASVAIRPYMKRIVTCVSTSLDTSCCCLHLRHWMPLPFRMGRADWEGLPRFACWTNRRWSLRNSPAVHHVHRRTVPCGQHAASCERMPGGNLRLRDLVFQLDKRALAVDTKAAVPSSAGVLELIRWLNAGGKWGSRTLAPPWRTRIVQFPISLSFV
jgi:hypothetical protein